MLEIKHYASINKTSVFFKGITFEKGFERCHWFCEIVDFHLSFYLNPISYKRFIPESLNRNIKQRNFLTRIRINNVFKKFLSEFNRRTMKDSNITPYDLKIKYLATLEGLTSGLGSEVFEPISLSVLQEGDLCNGGYYGKNSGR